MTISPTATHVLEQLEAAAGQEVSGQALCGQLGISRTAVWKQIQALRQQGYEIEAQPRRGYRLLGRPNRPLAAEVATRLTTTLLGRSLLYLPETDSTNRRLLELAEREAPTGMVVVAETQTGGRGRMSRSWFSPPGVNLYFSLLLRPNVPPLRVPPVALVVGLALRRAVQQLRPALAVRVKWPNDLFLDDLKLAGILCEMRGESDRVHHVVVGVGVNVNVQAEQFPAELRGRATSLRMASGENASRPALLAAFLNELEPALAVWEQEGLAPFLAELAAHSQLAGREVTAELPRGEWRGRAVGISASGALILELADGTRREVMSGDVHLRASGPVTGAAVG